MDVQELEELLRELLSAINSVVKSGEILNDEFQGMLAQTLEKLVNRIDELKSQSPVEGLQPEEQPLGPGFPSSNVHSFGYDPENKQLLVKFQGDYPQENGPIYAYEGVPPEIFALFQKGAVPARTDGQNKWGRWYKGKTPSLGASLYTLIRTQGYPYQRLT